MDSNTNNQVTSEFRKNQLLIFIIVILVLYIIISIYYDHTSMCDSLSGYWVATNDFLDEEQYDDYHLFISPKTENGDFKGFLMVVKNEQFIYNGPIVIKIYFKFKLGNDIQAYGKFIQFYSNDNPVNSNFKLPEDIKIKWSINGENIQIINNESDSSDDNIIFDGYKNIETTLVSKQEWKEFNMQEYYQNN